MVINSIPPSVRLVLLPVLMMLSITSNATHLVGGEISYTCLGNQEYEIKLRIYRDCRPDITGFDQSAALAVFDQDNNLIRNLRTDKGPSISVSFDTTANSCVTPPPRLCTEYAEYTAIVQLPPIPGGYVISHQRCCRNNSISNVNNPGNYGNTYTVSIPPNDSLCNSSPQFESAPPIVLCRNEPLKLPMKVTEADGDSLHFELCEVLHGGHKENVGGDPCLRVSPNPACPPPYTRVPFAGAFTSTNPFPASPAVSIDPRTGELRGTPTRFGQYLVGICVTEYRNGIPLSTVRLDYQFNVTNCIYSVVSDMVTPMENPEILCDGLTVQFESESQGAQKLLWDFGDPTTSADTSSSENPSYSYTLPGRYTISLVANPGLECSDTIRIPFDIKYPLRPAMADSGIFCFQAQEVYFKPQGNYPSDATFEWHFGSDANFPVVNAEIPPAIEWTTPGKHYVELTVRSGACSASVRDSVFISNLSVGVDAGPDQKVDEGDDIQLSATGGSEYYWFSDHPVDFSNPWGQSTIANPREPVDTLKFYVRVTNPLGCEGLDSMTVFINDGKGPINFFSPNEDGINDIFDISDINPEGDCRLSILNRWGSEVYFKDNYQNDWKGVDRGGNPLPDGTYYYILQCQGKVRWKDAVTILRNEQ